MNAVPNAIDEYRATGRPIELHDIVGRDRPLVIRGLCRDWPLVKLAEQSDTAFARGLAALDNGSEVDALLLPPGEDGTIGYNADFDGFNYEHHRVSITQGLQRLAHYSRLETAPGLAMQSALISACIPGFLDDHAVPFLDRHLQPRIWIGNKVTTPAHFDEYHNIAWYRVVGASLCLRRNRRATCISVRWTSRPPARRSASHG